MPKPRTSRRRESGKENIHQKKTQIIHFESPPRRKLRIREDEVLETIESGNIFNEIYNRRKNSRNY